MSCCGAVIAGLWCASLVACGPPAPPAAPGNSSPPVLALGGGDGCPEWGCGTNSAWLGERLVFHELHARGEPNDQKLRVARFLHRDASRLELKVQADHLLGGRDGHWLEGRDLEGAMLLLTRELPNKRTEFYWLRITDVGETQSWAPYVVGVPGARSSAPRSVPVYRFSFQQTPDPRPPDPAKPWKPVCRDNPDPDPKWRGLDGKALIFSGDRYHARDKVVVKDDADSPWFNIGCAGTAVAKMHLLHHTQAAGDPAPTVPQRQAVLKMLTADYCGTGRSFTLSGQPLDYNFDQRWQARGATEAALNVGAPGDEVEAIWTEAGAACLNNPRMAGQARFPLTAIHAECSPFHVRPAPSIASPGAPERQAPSRPDGIGFPVRPPACGANADVLANWQKRGYAISANPPPLQ
jgi:hypothetical protein